MARSRLPLRPAQRSAVFLSQELIQLGFKPPHPGFKLIQPGFKLIHPLLNAGLIFF